MAKLIEVNICDVHSAALYSVGPGYLKPTPTGIETINPKYLVTATCIERNENLAYEAVSELEKVLKKYYPELMVSRWAAHSYLDNGIWNFHYLVNQ